MTGDVAERDFVIRLPDGTTEDGPIADLRGADASVVPTPSQLRRAICGGCPGPSDAPIVHAPAPGRAHVHVARLAAETTVRIRPALAAVAAAHGVETPHDDDLADAIGSLRSLPPAPVADADLRNARRRAAEAGAETERLRERVATVRGRLTALRDGAAGDDEALTAAEASLSEPTRRLSEVATERVAAAQRLALLEERARRARDRREARLRLEDRIGNLERAVRAARVDAVADDFRDARRALAALNRDVDGDTAVFEATSELLDALAVVRVAPIRAPIVVDPEVAAAFGGPRRAFEALDAPLVIR
ncbi:DUF7856 family protein [Halobellus limi]|uniref:Uncharacterized protein n=1 Tax=Halobellus limi TaxID=699433 RepID=A0A1H5WB44_9EURY|nr:hypothetical protein [Halobellus limi]SEF96476.1 hypothetical protein SAMN04488133_1213 [Halobellus limi]